MFETEVLIAAARRGWQTREGPGSIPSARRRSRPQPVRDGVAIGAYIAEHAARRAAHEARIGVRSLVARGSRGHVEGGVRGSRRAAVVATATVTTPVLIAATVAQVMLGRLVPDLVTPLVRRLYALDRLSPLTGSVAAMHSELSAGPSRLRP